jgi:hypothetical protein
MTVQMGCASKFCRTEWTKFGLGKLGDVAPMGAHARDRSILFVLDAGRGRWRGRGRHRPLVWCNRGWHREGGRGVDERNDKYFLHVVYSKFKNGAEQ